MMYKIYSDSPQNANFGEYDSFLVAVQSVAYYQEMGQCFNGRIVVDIDANRIVLVEFSNQIWTFYGASMLLCNRFLAEKEKTEKI